MAENIVLKECTNDIHKKNAKFIKVLENDEPVKKRLCQENTQTEEAMKISNSKFVNGNDEQQFTNTVSIM